MIKIKKYEGENYFSNPTLIDTLELDKVTIEGFPVYNEEFENKFDSFSIKSDDFTIKFSMLQTDLSTLGKNIEDFFKLDPYNKLFAVRVNYGKTIGGIIDINSLEINKSYAVGEWSVTFKVYGFESELYTLAQQPPVKITNGSLNSFFNVTNYWLFWSLLQKPIYFNVDTSNLNWNTKIGFEPHLVYELWNEIIDAGRTTDTKRWDLFTDLLKAYGLVFKIEVDGFNENNYFFVDMRLYFRNEGNGDEVEIDVEDTFIQGFQKNPAVNKWIFFEFWQRREFLDVPFRLGSLFDGTNHYELTDKPLLGASNPVATSTMYETVDFNGNPIYFVRFSATINNLALPVGEVEVVEFSNYYDTVFGRESLQLTQYNYVIMDNPSPVQNIVNFLYGNGGGERWMSFPAMWIKSGYSIDTIDLPTLRPRYKVVNNLNGTSANQDLIMTNTQEQWLELTASTIPMTYTLGLSLLNKFDYKIFDYTFIEGNVCILYKLSNLDLPQRRVQSYWKQRMNGEI